MMLRALRWGELRAQAILSDDRPAFDHFAGTHQGVWAVIRKFLPSGIHIGHICLAPRSVSCS